MFVQRLLHMTHFMARRRRRRHRRSRSFSRNRSRSRSRRVSIGISLSTRDRITILFCHYLQYHHNSLPVVVLPLLLLL